MQVNWLLRSKDAKNRQEAIEICASLLREVINTQRVYFTQGVFVHVQKSQRFGDSSNQLYRFVVIERVDVMEGN